MTTRDFLFLMVVFPLAIILGLVAFVGLQEMAMLEMNDLGAALPLAYSGAGVRGQKNAGTYVPGGGADGYSQQLREIPLLTTFREISLSSGGTGTLSHHARKGDDATQAEP